MRTGWGKYSSPPTRWGEASGLVRAIHTNFAGKNMNKLSVNYQYVLYSFPFASEHNCNHYCDSILVRTVQLSQQCN